MKKIVVLLTALAMIFTCTACEGDKTTTGSKVEIADANEILAKTWAEYKASVSEDMVFPVGGGNAESMVMDEPAKFDTAVETAQDTLLASFCANAELVAMTDDVATMMNMMMANNFTAASYHISDVANVEKAVSSLKDTTISNQWMCGMPEKLIIVTVGENYVVSVFGNGQVIDAFKTAIITVYGDNAVVNVEENLAQ
jgi:hypothetical protein